MKAIKLEQGSEDWFKYKWGKFGGSTVKQFKTDKRNDAFFNVLSQLRRPFEIEDSFTSEAMERGNILEPEAREYLSQYTGITFEKQGVWEYNKYFGVSPDGANRELTIGCEIKCPHPKTHAKYIFNDVIPSEYLDQCISLFTANKNLKEVYFISYCPEDLYQQGFIKHITLQTTFEVKKSRFKTLKDGSTGKAKESYIDTVTVNQMVAEQAHNVNKFSEELETEITKIKNKL